MPVIAIRLVLVLAAVGFIASAAAAAAPSGAAPSPHTRHASKVDKAGHAAKADNTRHAVKADKTRRAVKADNTRHAIEVDKARKAPLRAVKHKDLKRKDLGAPLALTPATPSGTATIPAAAAVGPAPGNSAASGLPATIPLSAGPARPAVPARSAPALALAATASTSPLDLSAVKQALELARKGRQSEATGVEGTISDPLARKLVEWVILRSDDDVELSRYAAFLAANPSWPSILTLRRRAEAVLWQEKADPRTIMAFFRDEPPLSAKGQFALARALIAAGDRAGAESAVRLAWRDHGFSADVEAQARAEFAGLITPADDKARMDARLYVEDEDAGLRAAHHLDAVELAIARARAAVISRSRNAKALLEAVPEAARHDPGYMFSRVQWLRRADEAAEAAQWILAAPLQAERLGDPDQWWVERRLVARKLLDLGDFKTAYAVADSAAAPSNENYRADHHFTAGWIALRFLHQPAAALAHFAHIADGVTNPITLARAYYWQGRAAEALGREQDARAYYQAAARLPTAYYGQLARARLGLDGVTLRAVPEPSPQHHRLELARAFEILYAVDERDLVASMAADLGDKATDAGALATLAEIATRHHDARATLLIGKAALGRGYPFEQYAFPTFGIPSYQAIGPEVDRCVVYSIARQESAFNPRVVSSANALGLMQVTPEAGRFVARKFSVAFNQRRLLDDPVYNAQIGTAELGDEIREFGGSYILAFASYNAGPHRVKEWITQYGDPRNPKVDPVDWIERIPFSETRNYVQRVIENMQVYRARISNDPRLMIEADLRRGG